MLNWSSDALFCNSNFRFFFFWIRSIMFQIAMKSSDQNYWYHSIFQHRKSCQGFFMMISRWSGMKQHKRERERERRPERKNKHRIKTVYYITYFYISFYLFIQFHRSTSHYKWIFMYSFKVYFAKNLCLLNVCILQY